MLGRNSRRRSGSRWGVMAVIGLLALLATACNEEPAVEPRTIDTEVTDAAEFFADPAAVVGERIEASVVVDEVIDDNGFRAVAEDPGGQSYLVVHEEEVDVSQGAFVELTGTVAEFNMAEVEADLGVDLDDETFELFEGEYGIIADSVNVMVEG